MDFTNFRTVQTKDQKQSIVHKNTIRKKKTLVKKQCIKFCMSSYFPETPLRPSYPPQALHLPQAIRTVVTTPVSSYIFVLFAYLIWFWRQRTLSVTQDRRADRSSTSRRFPKSPDFSSPISRVTQQVRTRLKRPLEGPPQPVCIGQKYTPECKVGCTPNGRRTPQSTGDTQTAPFKTDDKGRPQALDGTTF